jgi:hypothetical protein
MESGYIYVIRSELVKNWIKIGRSTNLFNRMKSHSSSMPGNIENLLSFHADGYKKTELFLHHFFKNYRATPKREWFIFPDIIIKKIKFLNFILDESKKTHHDDVKDIFIKEFNENIHTENGICYDCGNELDLNSYNFHRDNNSLSKFKSICKKCRNEKEKLKYGGYKKQKEYRKEYNYISIINKKNKIILKESDGPLLEDGILLIIKTSDNARFIKFFTDEFSLEMNDFKFNKLLKGIKNVNDQLQINTNFYTYDYFRVSHVIGLFEKYCKTNVNAVDNEN